MDVGPSRELFELLAPDARNGLIITGYSIEGTLARVSAKWLWGGYLRFPVHSLQQWTFFLPFPVRYSDSEPFLSLLCLFPILVNACTYGHPNRTL